MFKNLKQTAIALALGAVIVGASAAPAAADDHRGWHGGDRGDHHDRDWHRHGEYYRGGYDGYRYAPVGYYRPAYRPYYYAPAYYPAPSYYQPYYAQPAYYGAPSLGLSFNIR